MPTDPTPRTANLQLTLPRERVASPETFKLESENIFSRNWIYVCRERELNNISGCHRFSIDENNLILIRDDQNDIRAFHNFCTHRGSELVTPENCDSIQHRIQCPYHAWTFERSGKLVAAPNMTNSGDFDTNQYGLKQVDCESWNGFIFVRLSNDTSNPQSLADFMSPLDQHAISWDFDRLDVAAEVTYDVNANWKLIFQNYNECYHCPSVHPVLNRLTPFKGATNDLGDGPILGGPMKLSDGSESMTMDGKAVGKILPKLNDTQRKTVAYYTIFPTMFLSAHPDFVLIHRIQRTRPNQTHVACQFLFHPDSIAQPNFDPSSAVEFWDMTNRQDWNVCELAHRGASSAGFEPGPYSDLESVVAAFDRYYRKQLMFD